MKILSRAAFSLFFFFLLAGIEAPGDHFALAAEKIDINSAPIEDLIKIIHIGEIRAKEIISLRPFSSLDELAKIKGIGEARIKDIKKEGIAWIAPNQPQSKTGPGPQEESSIEFNPDSGNMISLPAAQEKISEENSSRKPEEKQLQEQSLANISRQAFSITDSFPHVILIASGMAIFSGAVIIFLKKSLI